MLGRIGPVTEPSGEMFSDYMSFEGYRESRFIPLLQRSSKRSLRLLPWNLPFLFLSGMKVRHMT